MEWSVPIAEVMYIVSAAAADLPRLRRVAETGLMADDDRLFDYGLKALVRGAGRRS